MYRLPSQVEIKEHQITKQLNKIFEQPKSENIFQSHFPRDSAITELMGISHFQTIYNIFAAIFTISFLHTFVANYLESGTWLDLEILIWAFRDFTEVRIKTLREPKKTFFLPGYRDLVCFIFDIFFSGRSTKNFGSENFTKLVCLYRIWNYINSHAREHYNLDFKNLKKKKLFFIVLILKKKKTFFSPKKNL